jgi:hypothetical protein
MRLQDRSLLRSPREEIADRRAARPFEKEF